ncbi:gastrula zinc finger protein XlCGF49.1-like [Argiope bruennichi]|uniref:gastrula zinc finger protein XlCGF49.1-like n=1 Tax=Argiope bruennichi TaxID=94029 RepID=UPI00249542E6|nr:gastrula zinc finger protein XlCGF49.1-like [Argiope bruennichi]
MAFISHHPRDKKGVSEVIPESFQERDKITGSYNCQFCNYSSVLRANVKKHIRTHTGERTYSCTVCHKRFSSKANLNVHFRLHTGALPYECPHCGKRFNEKKNMHLHLSNRIQANLEASPSVSQFKKGMYSCSLCSYSTSVETRLRSHEKIHIGEQKFFCPVCERSFNKKSNLKVHLRLHSGNLPYECPACKKRFNEKRNMVLHYYTHK